VIAHEHDPHRSQRRIKCDCRNRACHGAMQLRKCADGVRVLREAEPIAVVDSTIEACGIDWQMRVQREPIDQSRMSGTAGLEFIADQSRAP
jgi:hypothetical protein